MTFLDLLQQNLNAELSSSERDSSAIEGIETQILHSMELRTIVTQRAQERRGLQSVPAYDPDHVPGVLSKHTIKHSGKEREVFSPADLDYPQAQYYQIGIIGPVADYLVHANTYAYRTGMGTETAIIDAIAIASSRPDCMMFQEDIADCFGSIPAATVKPVFSPKAWNYVDGVRGRFRELVQGAPGLPQGHPIAASCVNVAIHFMLLPIRQRYAGIASILVYSDDITVAAPRGVALQIIAEIKAALAAHGMRLNPSKARATRPAQGKQINLLGYQLEWQKPQGWPVIRPQRKAYQRLADALANSVDNNHATAIKHGWANAYRLTNDPRHLDCMKSAIQDGTRRWRENSANRTQCPNPGDI